MLALPANCERSPGLAARAVELLTEFDKYSNENDFAGQRAGCGWLEVAAVDDRLAVRGGRYRAWCCRFARTCGRYSFGRLQGREDNRILRVAAWAA